MNEDLAEALETLRVKHAATLDINERIALRFAVMVLRGPSEVEPEQDADGWIRWDGNAPHPNLPLDTRVDVRFDNNDECENTDVNWWYEGAGINNWTTDRPSGRIVAYKVVK